MTAGGGYYYIVGYGEEIKILAVDVIISEKNIVGNLVGTWSELYELMELANKGYVKLSMEEYKLESANKALHDLNEGLVKGRAVLIPCDGVKKKVYRAKLCCQMMHFRLFP